MNARFAAAFALVLGTPFAAPAVLAAEAFPARPVRLVVPFAAGGPTDVAARVVAQHLSELWGRSAVVDNRPGAGGLLGGEIAAKATPDGYTLLLGSNSTFAVNAAVFSKMPFDVTRDFRIIGLVAYAPHLLVIRSGVPANSVAELVALAKKQPGKLTFGSSGTGAVIHMAGELFKYHAGIDLVHVPFKGGAPATVAMLAGEVDMMVNDLSQFLPHIKAGRMRALAAAWPKRVSALPDVPTFAELGMPKVESSNWFGLAAPSKTPPEIVRVLVASLGKVLVLPEYRERLATMSMEPLVLPPDQVAVFARQELDKWVQVANAAKIRLD
jgi:tripartite-type tricarboxylate transporter receptor subunit TctC